MITHLNSKKINVSHLSQPEKPGDSFAPSRRVPAGLPWFSGTSLSGLLQPACSSEPDRTLLGSHARPLVMARALKLLSSSPCFLLSGAPLAYVPEAAKQSYLKKNNREEDGGFSAPGVNSFTVEVKA